MSKNPKREVKMIALNKVQESLVDGWKIHGKTLLCNGILYRCMTKEKPKKKRKPSSCSALIHREF